MGRRSAITLRPSQTIGTQRAMARPVPGHPLRTSADGSQGEHRGGDLVGGGVMEGGAHVVQDEQPRSRDGVGECLAVADREEWVRAAMHDERRQREFVEALTPPRGAVEPAEDCSELVRLVYCRLARWCAVPDPYRRRAPLVRVIAQQLGADGSERGDGRSV